MSVNLDDVSKDWTGSTDAERMILNALLAVEATPAAILLFAELQDQLGDYWYWFTLGTLWVSYSGHSDLELWRRLFRSDRPRRHTSLMKPSELREFDKLPNNFVVYRAHRPNENSWISYTLSEELANRWADERGGYVRAYALRKKDCLALFLRRGEQEILMLEPWRARPIEE